MREKHKERVIKAGENDVAGIKEGRGAGAGGGSSRAEGGG